MFERRYEFLKWRRAAAEALVTAIAFELAYVTREHLPALRVFYLPPAIMVGLLFAVLAIWTGVGAMLGSYRRPDLPDFWRATRKTFRQSLCSSVILFCVLYVLKLDDVSMQLDNVSRLFMFLFVVLNTLLLLGYRLLAPTVLRSAGAGAKRYYVIVGCGEDALALAQRIENHGGTGQVLTFVRDGAPAGERDLSTAVQLPDSGRTISVAEPGRMAQILRDHTVDEVIFAADHRRSSQLQELFRVCEEEGVKMRVMVNLFPIGVSTVSLDKLDDLPLLTFSTAPDNDYLLFAKRVFDLGGAVALAIALAPFALLIMLAIRMTSKGPVFFVQERCGLNGRRFRMFKFRSMYRNAHALRETVAALNEMDGPVFKCAHDPRVTPLGRILRKFSIDEWPQLVNVIKGDMSLVGPRPPLPEEVEQYKQWQRRRLRMRPGLTCLWALAGRNKLDFLSWMRLDLQYIESWSLALDCKILLQSIPHVIAGKGM